VSPRERREERFVIEKTIERWHAVLAAGMEGLDDLLADDVVFHSPVVFTPQEGKHVTKLYLGAAYSSFGGEPDAGSGGSAVAGGSFRYTKQILAGRHAALEFETRMDGKYVNGVDLITCDDAGRIVEFKVMIRPLQAIQAVHARMARMLEALKGRD
jgi:hypothetical protein